MGVSYYAVATSLIGLVGDYLFDDRKQQDRASTNRLAQELAPLYLSSQTELLQERLEAAAAELGARLMVLDMSGKVQADSESELNGSRMELPEVASILSQGKTEDYGVHQTESENTTLDVLGFFRPYDHGVEWVAYSTAGLTQNGQTIGVLLLTSPMQGTMERLFGTVDRLAAALKAKGESEKKAKEFLKDTISDISHQLKTPLAALMMYQEILESEPENSDTVREFASKMGASLQRMEQLIQSMLKITRLDSGSIVFERRDILVTELIDRAIRDLQTRADQEGKTIQIEGKPEERLLCDPEWTSEALGNLVKNALDHTAAGGHIRIAWSRTPAMLQIRVSDNGNGISSEDIHHIFKRFYRSRHTLDAPGIGLGLPLAKSIVEGQGGVITVQSTPGEGATFTVSFLTKL